MGAKWDFDNTLCFYPSANQELPQELQKYKCHKCKIDKELGKQPSIGQYWPNLKLDWFATQKTMTFY